MKAIIEKLNSIGDFILTQMISELVAQGHNATGDLIHSISFDIDEREDFIVLNVRFLDYGFFLETGRRAGSKRVPIDILVDWVITKAIAQGETEALRIAYAIQTKIFQEGSPTRGSLKFSSTGKRDEWFSNVVNDELMETVEQEVAEGAAQEVETFFDNLVEKYKIEFA